MKADDRKELKSNTLVATLEKVGHGLKEGPSRRTVVVLGIIGLLVVLVVVWKVATNMSLSRNSGRWKDLYTADSPESVSDLSEKHKNTPQGRGIRLQIARDQLLAGLDEIYTDRVKGGQNLKDAAEGFEQLAKEFKAVPILVQECLLGAGEAREALGEFDEAVKRYKELTEKFPDSKLAEQAKDQVHRVETKKADYEKLQAQLNKDQK
jgi:tetratricopeptide (TPR) repeat protein